MTRRRAQICTHLKAVAGKFESARPLRHNSVMQTAHHGPTVFIVDDDSAIRVAMQALLESVGLQHEILPSADAFLAKHGDGHEPGCLVLDIRMPGLGGLELQDQLLERGNSIPIIFITGYGDVPMAVEAMQKGAVDFIEKPFRNQELLDRIHLALRTDEARRAETQRTQAVRSRIDKLTQREREVFELVVTGKPNKIIAFELGVSQRTVEIHRARVMKKMQARSLADLVRLHVAVSSAHA